MIWLLLIVFYAAPDNAVNWDGPWKAGMSKLMDQRFASEADCRSQAIQFIGKMHEGMLAPMRFRWRCRRGVSPKGRAALKFSPVSSERLTAWLLSHPQNAPATVRPWQRQPERPALFIHLREMLLRNQVALFCRPFVEEEGETFPDGHPDTVLTKHRQHTEPEKDHRGPRESATSSPSSSRHRRAAARSAQERTHRYVEKSSTLAAKCFAVFAPPARRGRSGASGMESAAWRYPVSRREE